jgi:8-oxo-dGTP pyrophosphatase MutT (NUDIX family)
MNKAPTRSQVSAGGVAFRRRDDQIEVVIISVGAEPRWQLPKGLVDEGESPEVAAIREVHEEAGIETAMMGPIDTIEYWYWAKSRGQQVRFHKFVHYYLLRYVAGDSSNHDHEVNEARWVEIGQAQEMLAFKNEKGVVARAREMILAEKGVAID